MKSSSPAASVPPHPIPLLMDRRTRLKGRQAHRRPHRAGTDLRRELVACLLAHAPPSQELEPPANPERFTPQKKKPRGEAGLGSFMVGSGSWPRSDGSFPPPAPVRVKVGPH